MLEPGQLVYLDDGSDFLEVVSVVNVIDTDPNNAGQPLPYRSRQVAVKHPSDNRVEVVSFNSLRFA